MRLISAAIFASVLIAAGPVLAKEPKEPKEAKEGKPASERKICRKVEVTHSRLAPQRECRTAAEWDAIRREAGGSIRDGASEGQRIN